MRRKELLALVGVLVVAAIVRIIYAAVARYPITADGVYYALLAENWFSGAGYAVWGEPHTVFPPGYPAATGPLTWIVGDAEGAARVVSFVAGVLVSVPLYLWTRRMYEVRTAFFSSLLLAFYGRHARLSTAVLSEPLFTLLIVAMLYFGWRAAENPGLVHLGTAGVFGAWAYLTRPEGAVFFALFLLYFFAEQLLRRSIAEMMSRLSGGAFAILVFLALALPYIAFLHTHTGKWQLSGKTRLNMVLGEAAGNPDPLWGEKIVFHLSPDRTRVTLAGELTINRRVLLRRYVVNLQEQEALLLSMLGLPGTLLAALGFLGGWTDTEERRKTLYLLMMLAPMLVFPLFFVEARFLIPFVPVLLIWVARGLTALADWFRATFVEKASLSTIRSRGFSPRDIAFQSTGVFTVVVVVLLLLYFSTPLVKWAVAGPPDETEKHFGLALRRELGELRGEFLMSRDPIVAFYAGAEHFPLPYVERYDDLLACLRINRVRYLLVDERVIPSLRPALASLLDPTLYHEGLTPRYTFQVSRKLIVYECQLR